MQDLFIAKTLGVRSGPALLVVQAIGNTIRLIRVEDPDYAACIRDDWRTGNYSRTPGELRTIEPRSPP